jgi:YNFM family putative membrane transporter
MPSSAPNPAETAPQPQWVERGSRDYRKISFALFLAGFSTFSLLYCVQPLLPAFAKHFAVSPAGSSLALSLSTGMLALAILCAAALSESLGRRGLMFASMAGAALMNIGASLTDSWSLLLVLRALEGLVLGGVPAVAMAYLAEEIEPKGLGKAMGLYVSGTAFGGMTGRVAVGFLADSLGWRIALEVVGIAGLAAAAGFILLLPASRNFTKRQGVSLSQHISAWLNHLRHPALPLIFLIGFLSMGAFVTLYNYAGFHLLAPPYALSQSDLGLIFTAYTFGILSSSIAGTLSDRFGRRWVLPCGLVLAILGAALTLGEPLWMIIAGVIVLTFGFFMAHSAASSWVGRLARHSKGHASSLYLLGYYVGSSVAGSVGGWFWSAGAWTAVIGYTIALLLAGLVVAIWLRTKTAPGDALR